MANCWGVRRVPRRTCSIESREIEPEPVNWGVWSLLVASFYQYMFSTHFSAANENRFEQGPLIRSNLETDVNIA